MADHPPPPRLIDLHSATQILSQTTAAVFSTRHHLRIFLLLSFLLFSLRFTLENLTQLLTPHFTNDPFVKSLLNQTHLPPFPATTQPRRRHPFPRRNRFGVLNDLAPDNLDHRFFDETPKPQMNHTSFKLDNGIRVSETVRPGFRFLFSPFKIMINNTNESETGTHLKKLQKLQFLIEFTHEVYTLLYYLVFFTLSYGFMVLGFVAVQVWVHGVIFVFLVNGFLNNHTSLINAFRQGAILGSRRLSGFMILRWVVRDAMSQILAVIFFRKVKNPYTIFKIFIWVKFMPYSADLSPLWVKDFDREVSWFMLSWFLLEMVVSFVSGLSAWVAMEDPQLPWREVVNEGCRLLSLRIDPAVNLKTVEDLVCRMFAGYMVTNLVGGVLGSMIQSFLEVYFLVAWMMHYFAVKSIDAVANGEPFGNAQFEDMLQLDR